MRWLIDLSLVWKIRIPVLILALILALLGFLSLDSAQRAKSQSQLLSQNYLTALDSILLASQTLSLAQGQERLFLLELASYQYELIADVEAQRLHYVQQSQAHLLAAQNALADAKFQSEVQQLNQHVTQWLAASNEIIALANFDKMTEAVNHSLDQDKQHFASFNQSVNNVKQYLRDQVAAINQKNAAFNQQRIEQQIIMLTIGALIVLLSITYVPNLISKNVKLLSAGMMKVADGDGDLSQRIHIESNDEVGITAQAFNRLQQKLAAALSLVAHAGSDLDKQIVAIKQNSETNQQLTSKQQQQLNDAVTAIKLLNSNIDHIYYSAEQGATHATAAKEQADIGTKVISESTKQVNELSGLLHKSANTIRDLNSKALEIGGVINVIKEIAEQTNLLALNAAIEAARAGEQGRGFAVVADEVRALANRTATSTDEIQAMISSIQSGVAASAAVMQSSTEQIDVTVEQVGQANAAFSQILTAIDLVSQISTSIVASTTEQQNALTTINSTMQSVDDNTHVTLSNAVSLSDTVNTLAIANNELITALASFKLQ